MLGTSGMVRPNFLLMHHVGAAIEIGETVSLAIDLVD
jgi:hypothetical protein